MLLDLVGASLDLLSTWYFIRLNTKAWPVGLAAAIVNTSLYWNQAIYADMCLSCFYCLNFIYGWYAWSQPHKKVSLETSQELGSAFWIKMISLFTLLFSIIFFLLLTRTDTNVPFLDAVTTSLSVIGQWLMCHKIILAWTVWLITDILYIFLYIIKELPGHTLLMIVYTVLAVVGFQQWRKTLVTIPALTAKNQLQADIR